MAGSRTEKLGTVFSRVQGLLRSGAMKEVDRPLWYDVYAAFPPRIEPKFDRFIEEQEPRCILYKEDALRVKFYNTFGNPDVIDMKQTNLLSYSERFIRRYGELESQAKGQMESELMEAVKESLKSEGIVLKTLAEIEKEKRAIRKSKTAHSKESNPPEHPEGLETFRIKNLTEDQEGIDFVYDETLKPGSKQD